MIKLSDSYFDREALVRGWNHVIQTSSHMLVRPFTVVDVMVLGEKLPGIFAIIWSLYDTDTDQIVPVRLDATGELLRELEATGRLSEDHRGA